MQFRDTTARAVRRRPVARPVIAEGRLAGTLEDPLQARTLFGLARQAEVVQRRLRRPKPVQRPRGPAQAPIQRNYAGLGAMGKARVDQQADEKYATKAQEFEGRMAREIEQDDTVGSAITLFVRRLKNVVDAWAAHTGKQKGETYEREFGWPPGRGYYGAFEMTANNITNLFANPDAKPQRMRLKLIYNAVRNGNIAKWLKLAAVELHRAANNQTARDWRIRNQSKVIETTNTGLRIRERNEDLTVTKGFARDSGLNAYLQQADVNSLNQIATQERQTRTNLFGRNPREVFDQGRFSKAIGWSESMKKADKERVGRASTGVGLNDQRHLTVGDVPDLADEEVDLILKRRGTLNPTNLDRQGFTNQNANSLGWSQGGEHYDVELGTESTKEAMQIKARMEAGISGSTDLMLHALSYFDQNPNSLAMKGLRLGLAGWMMANRDHSFYEVMRASVPYGMTFHTDPANPGIEYEDARNIGPMQANDFNTLLGNDGPLNQPFFPRAYLGAAYKDHLANNLQNANRNQAHYKNALHNLGVSKVEQSVMTPRETAALTRLEEVVQAQNIAGNASAALKRQALRRIREHTSFVLLANTFGTERANALLNTLLLNHHANKGVTDTSAKARLVAAGVPDVIVANITNQELTRVDAVRAAVQNAVPNAGNLPMNAINQALGQLVELGNTDKARLKPALIRHYHPNINLDGDTINADTQDRIRQIEAIAATNRTTATWYTWSTPQAHQNMIGAGSLLSATANVPSTQGPGLYLGRLITTSSGYGAQNGRRVMLARMSGVPTLDANDAGQMARLGLLQPRGNSVDPLEAAYVYDRTVRAEFLMIYGAGNFARLTTNKSVDLTMDVRRAPVDDLRNAYQNQGLWAGNSRANFAAQAQHYGLDISGW